MRGVGLVGLVAILMTACGRSDDRPAVPEGLDGLDHVRTQAIEGLQDVAPAVAEATGATARDAEGHYEEAGYAGTTLLYDYVARVNIAGEQPIDISVVRGSLEESGLSATLVGQERGVQGITADGPRYAVTAQLDDDGTVLSLGVVATGAEVSQDDLRAARRAELREPEPLSLD